jgi:hypothetical protein
MRENSITPQVNPMNNVTKTAKYAAFGLPAPNSFEILVLYMLRKHVTRFVIIIIIITSKNNNNNYNYY